MGLAEDVYIYVATLYRASFTAKKITTFSWCIQVVSFYLCSTQTIQSYLSLVPFKLAGWQGFLEHARLSYNRLTKGWKVLVALISCFLILNSSEKALYLAF